MSDSHDTSTGPDRDPVSPATHRPTHRTLPAGLALPTSTGGWLVVALVVALLLMAVALLVLPPKEELPAARPTATGEVSATHTETTAPTAPTADKRVAPGKPPDRLVVPAISLDAPLVPIEVEQDGSLDPPSDTDIVGWWQRSAHPGQMPGQTVLTGHTVHTGGGVMNELGDLQRGEEVTVHDDGRAVTYAVTEVLVYTREQVAEKAQGLFGQDRPGGRLVLVTCTDWNGSSYDSNIIVLGEPVAIERESAPAG